MVEPHRFTAIMTCLTHIARQIVQQTPSYSQGQIYVLPLLMSVLPGIDLNDMKKTSVTLKFLDIILTVITCVDCSSAVNTRNDLTEVRSNLSFEKNVLSFSYRLKKKYVYQQHDSKILSVNFSIEYFK
jgi:proteasome activator subunit 4